MAAKRWIVGGNGTRQRRGELRGYESNEDKSKATADTRPAGRRPATARQRQNERERERGSERGREEERGRETRMDFVQSD